MPVSTHLSLAAATLTLSVAWGGAALAQQPAPQNAAIAAARAALIAGNQFLDRSDYRRAESTFVATIGMLPAPEAALRADALFGRGFSAQQRFLSGDTASTVESRAATAAAFESFRASLALSPTRYAAAAHNNIAVMFRALGQRDSAVRYFTLAAAGPSRDRASYLLSAARELDVLSSMNPSLADSARVYYTRVLEVDKTRGDALRDLLMLQLRVDSMSVVLATAKRWSVDSAMAQAVAAFLPNVLALPEPTSGAYGTRAPGRFASSDEASQALVTYAVALPIARLSPSTLDVSTRDRLRTARDVHPSLAGAIDALVSAYTPLDAGRVYREDAAAVRWWHNETERHRAWSSLLRWVGDCYNEQDAQLGAQSYYEAAIGQLSANLNEPWVDRAALLPLALLYAEQPDGPASASRLNTLVARLYEAKGPAIQNADLPRMYDYHLTLGTLYAARGQWSGNGAGNAEFQLEHLRDAAKGLRDAGTPAYVPPQLLEKLGAHYQRTSNMAKVAEVKQDLRTDFARRGSPADAEAIITRIERPPPAAPRSPDTKTTLQRITPSMYAKALAGGTSVQTQAAPTAPSRGAAPATVVPPPSGRAAGISTVTPGAVSSRGSTVAAPNVSSKALQMTTYTGSVTTAAGVPKDVRAWLVVDGKRGADVTLNTTGRFSARTFGSPADVKLHVEADGYAATDVPLKAGAAVAITLEPAGRGRRGGGT